MSAERRARLLRAAIAQRGPVDPATQELGDWVTLATAERVVPLLYRVVVDARSALDDHEFGLLVGVQCDVMAAAVRFEYDLLEVAEAISGRFPFAVLKGLAVAHLDYSDPAMRQFADVDLLVAPADLAAVVELLGGLGWRQAYPLPRHHERFTHAITLRNERRVEIDLHQRIAHRALGECLPTDDLLHRRVAYEIAGETVWALDDADRMVHACVHAATSRAPYRRLSSVADVLVMAERLTDRAPDVLDRAASRRLGNIVRRGVETAFDEAQLPVPDAWQAAMSTPVGPRDRLVERAYLADRRRPVVEELAYLRLMRGWRDRFDYVRGYFATDPDYARQNQRSGLRAQTRYLWSRLRSSGDAS